MVTKLVFFLLGRGLFGNKVHPPPFHKKNNLLLNVTHSNTTNLDIKPV